MKELQMTIMVEEPYAYSIEKRIVNSIVDRKYKLIAFYKSSYADENIDKNYWIKVNYSFLPTKSKGGTSIVWYEFKGKHIQIIN